MIMKKEDRMDVFIELFLSFPMSPYFFGSNSPMHRESSIEISGWCRECVSVREHDNKNDTALMGK